MQEHGTRLIRQAQKGESVSFAALYDLHPDDVYQNRLLRLSEVKLAENLTS